MALLTSPTLQNLLTSVRTMLKQRDPSNSTWTEAELTDYINEGIRMYFLECAMLNEGYFTTQTDLDIVAETETIALPTDCFQIKNVWKKVTNGFIILPYRNTVTEGYSTQGGTSSESYIPYYYFQGSNLLLRPTPNFNETAGIRIEYIQFPDNMIWGGDAMTNQVSPVFKQLIVMYAVYKAKLSESLVNGVAMHAIAEQDLNKIYVLFKDALAKRSKNPTYISPYNPEVENW